MATIASFKKMSVDRLEYEIVCLRERCKQCIDNGDYEQLVKYAKDLQRAAEVMMAKPIVTIDNN